MPGSARIFRFAGLSDDARFLDVIGVSKSGSPAKPQTSSLVCRLFTLSTASVGEANVGGVQMDSGGVLLMDKRPTKGRPWGKAPPGQQQDRGSVRNVAAPLCAPTARGRALSSVRRMTVSVLSRLRVGRARVRASARRAQARRLLPFPLPPRGQRFSARRSSSPTLASSAARNASEPNVAAA